MKIKERRIRRKNEYILMKGYYQKTGWTDFDGLQVTDSTLNEDINSLVMSESGWEGWFVVCCHITSTIKLAMADIQKW